MPSRLLLLPLVILLGSAAWCGDGRTAQGSTLPNACGDSAAISWAPASPRDGALFRVRVSRLSAGVTASGEFAGEPLHLAPAAGSSAAESFAAVPIDANDSLAIVVRCVAGERTDTLRASVAPSRGEYPVEKLRVAPTFGRAPDSALAARIRRESERANAVAVASHETPRLWTAPFRHPRESRIT